MSEKFFDKARKFLYENFSIIGTGGLLLMSIGIYCFLIGHWLEGIAVIVIGYFLWRI